MKRLTNIIRQSKYWQLYGYISPIAFVLVASGLAGIHYANTQEIVVSSWILLMASAIVWWFWTIKVIIELTQAFQTIMDQILGLRSDVSDVAKDIKDLPR